MSMGTKFLATANAESFTNGSHSVLANFRQGHFSFNETTSAPSGISDPDEPYNGFVEGLTSQDLVARPTSPMRYYPSSIPSAIRMESTISKYLLKIRSTTVPRPPAFSSIWKRPYSTAVLLKATSSSTSAM